MRQINVLKAVVAALVLGYHAANAQDCVPLGDTCVTAEQDRVTIAGGALADLPRLADTSWITDVRLVGPVPDGLSVDLSALGSATGLRALSLEGLKGVDLDALPALAITGLTLEDNGLTDLAFLSRFDRLVALQLDEDVALADVPEVIAARIQYLYPSGRTRLHGGAAFVNTTILSLFDRTRPDLDGLGLLPSLETLTIIDGAVESLDGLVPGPRLTDVVATGTGLRDISALAGAASLERLGAKNTRLDSIAALTGKTRLRDVSVTNTEVSDLSPLRGADRLALLGISGTPVTDISPLAALPELVGLYMNVTRVTDFTPLLANRPDLMLRINSDEITFVNGLDAFIAAEGWKRGPLYEK